MKRIATKGAAAVLALLLILLLLPVTGSAAELTHANFAFDPTDNMVEVSFYYSDNETTAKTDNLIIQASAITPGTPGDTINGAKFDVRDSTGAVIAGMTATASDHTLTQDTESINVGVTVSKGPNTADIDTRTITGDCTDDTTCYLYYDGTQITGGGTSSFTLRKTIAKRRSECAITSFSIDGNVGTITDSTGAIAVRVPYAANISSLVAAFTCSPGATVNINGIPQYSNANANNFTNTLDYTVVAEDGVTTREYNVTVTRGKNAACDITSFAITGQDSVEIDSSRTPGSIIIHMPSSSTVTSITTIPSITLSEGATISPAANEQKQFSSTPVIYTVTAENGVNSKVYNVTLGANTSGGSSAAAITSYSVNIGGVNYTGLINETAKTITVTLPAGIARGTGVASFTLSPGAIARINNVQQVSGTTSNDFSAAKIYTVTAQDGTTRVNYTVTVTSGGGGGGVTTAPTATARNTAKPTPTPPASAIPAGWPVTNLEGSISVVASAGYSGANPSLITTLLFAGDVYNEMKKAVGDAKILTAYDITLVNPGTYRGPYTVTFNVGRSNVGRIVTVLHRKSERNYETAFATVDGTGRLAIRASSLSPFMILNGIVYVSGAATEVNTIPLGPQGATSSSVNVIGVPKTGAFSETGYGLIFMIIAVMLAILIVLYLKMDEKGKEKE